MSVLGMSVNYIPPVSHPALDDANQRDWLESIPEPCLLCVGHVIVRANDEAAALLAMESTARLAGKSLFGFLGESEQAKADAYLSSPAHAGAELPLYFAIPGRSLLLKTGKPFRDGKSRLVQLSPATEPATGGSLGPVLDSVAVGLISCELLTGTLSCNSRFREQFSLPASAIPTLDELTARLHPAEIEPLRSAVQTAIETSTLFDATFRIVHADGELHWIRAVGRASHESARFDGLTLDVTSQMSAQLALVENERRLKQNVGDLIRTNDDLNQFAYIAHHDLQEPLRIVASYSQLLQRRYGGQLDAAADQYIAYVVEGSKRMSLLLQDLLSYSAATSGPRAFAPVSSQEVVNAAVRNLRPFLNQCGARVRFENLPVLEGDKAQLSQLFESLIGNAIKFRSDHPLEIGIAAESQDGSVRFTVSDNGIGIARQYHERIFGLFKRLHGHKYPGTGVGLAICKKLVERHGGRIWVESEPDKGARFHFTLRATPSEKPIHTVPKP